MKKVRQLYNGANGAVLVTIPKQILDFLNTKAGDSVVFVAEEGKVEIRKLEI